MDKIKPALSPERWERALQTRGGPRAMDSVFEGADEEACHYIAALALHGQPFGFTWGDVDLVNAAARSIESEWNDHDGAADLKNLADRIAALLPPRG